MRRFLVVVMLFGLVTPTCNAWWECGHHIVALLAYDQLTPYEQKSLLHILRCHPRFEQDFTAPENTPDIVRWQVGHAGYWPDIARGLKEYHRSTWHYQLGSTLTIGETDTPDNPGPLPDDATLETQELHVCQAIELCRQVLADRSISKTDRALAICWLAHCVGDLHQPCHAGSLYVDKVFPEGDRGGNSISTVQGRNLHSLWDGLLGTKLDAADATRRMNEIKSDAKNWKAATSAARHLDPVRWMEESREIAKKAVYTVEILNPVEATRRSDSTKVEKITLSEDYLKTAGRISKQRVAFAAHRLAAVWRLCLKTDAELIAKSSREKVRVWFGPSRETSHIIRDTVAAAQNNIDIAIYNFSDKAVRTELSRAAKRGVAIRVLLNEATRHKALANGLEEDGLDVRYVSQTMHHKFCIVDNRELLTGSGNWSPQSYVRYDEDLLKFRRSPEIISAFRTEFDFLWAHSNEFGLEVADSRTAWLRPKIADVHFTSANMSPFETPKRTTFRTALPVRDGVCGRRLIYAIDGARESILIATTHFRRGDIANALKRALARGVKVEMVLDMQEYHRPDTKMSNCRFDEQLAEFGVKVGYKFYSKDWKYGTALQMHTKFAVIDRAEVLTGSFNYSENSELKSFENLLSIRDRKIVDAYQKRFRTIQSYGQGELQKVLQQIKSSDGTEPSSFSPITLDSAQIFRLRATFENANIFRD